MRSLHEVVELDRDCELGDVGERAVVTAIDDGRYMTLVFPYREPGRREVRTGADYRYLVGAPESGAHDVLRDAASISIEIDQGVLHDEDRQRLFGALHTYFSTRDMRLAHMTVAAMNGEAWAATRILRALDALDFKRPDGAVPRAALKL